MTTPRTGKSHFHSGMTIGGITLLEQVAGEGAGTRAVWWVRYQCCGCAKRRSYTTLEHYSRPGQAPQRCVSCQRLLTPQKRLPVSLRITLQPADAWPRPHSLAGQPPGVWGEP